MKTGYFTEEEIPDMSHDEFERAIEGLLDKGLMEVEERNGIKYYRATSLCEALEAHFDSDPNTRN